ncbi:MAG: alanine racemase [Verrucomicrobiota bacterium]
MNHDYPYRCWAEIDAAALRHNATVLRERVGPGVALLAVVKANAYGHGLVPVVQTLAAHVQLFGVANLEEAIAVREILPHPIIILGPALPGERVEIVARGFVATVSSLAEAEDFVRLGGTKKQVPICFKIDTGMGRMGVPESEAVALFRQVSELPHLTIHSVSTHLPVSNEDEHFTRAQLERFSTLVQRLRREVPGHYKVHALQTVGVLAFSAEPYDIVRPGILYYGLSPLPEFQHLLRPAMTWKTRVILIRDMPAGHGISYGRSFITSQPTRVATLSAGYADGYPRHLSNRDASVLVRGQRCPLLGRVTMDLMAIDVTKVPEAQVGDEVVLMGRQGEAEIGCHELAERADTILWEITTRIGARVRRVLV